MNNIVLSISLFFCLVTTFSLVGKLVTLASHALVNQSYKVEEYYIIIPSVFWAFFYYLLLTVK